MPGTDASPESCAGTAMRSGHGGATRKRGRQRQTAKQNAICDPSPTHAERRPFTPGSPPTPAGKLRYNSPAWPEACIEGRRFGRRRQSRGDGFTPSRKRTASASRTGAWPFKILRAASAGVNQAARSTSGKSCVRPDRGGHSMANVLLVSLDGSASPSTAHTSTVLALDWRKLPSATTWPLQPQPGLLGELPPGCRERVLAGLAFAFRDAPGAFVLLHPEGSARVHQEHLDAVRCAPVQRMPALRLGMPPPDLVPHIAAYPRPGVGSHAAGPEAGAFVPDAAVGRGISGNMGASVAAHQGILVVREDTIIKGEIRNCRQMEVYGYVEGDMAAETLLIHPGGQCYGTVKTESAEIRGTLQGDVVVKHLISIREHGLGHRQRAVRRACHGAGRQSQRRGAQRAARGCRRSRSDRRQGPLRAHHAGGPARRRPRRRRQGPRVQRLQRPQRLRRALQARPGRPAAKFTQADLEGGRVIFTHDGTATRAASFDVVVADHTGATSGAPQTVKVTVRGA